MGIWDIVQILPVGITETSYSAFNSEYPALQSKIQWKQRQVGIGKKPVRLTEW